MLALRLAFFVFSLSLLVATHVYLYRRLLPQRWRGPTARRVALAGAGLVLVSAIGARLAWQAGAPAARWLGIGLLTYLGFFLYLLMGVAAGDSFKTLWALVARSRGQQPPPPTSAERRRFLAGTLAAGSAAAAGGLGAFGTFRAFEPPQVTEVPIRLPGLPAALEGFTLVHLSDIHVGMVIRRPFLEQLVRHANALRPDLVAITGDLVDGSVAELGPTVAALQALSARHGTFFVTGNHDYYSGADAWTRALHGLGITPLRNRKVTIGEPSASFELAGVDDWHARFSGGGYDLDRALAGWSAGQPLVLLAHQPSNFDEVARRGVGLQLSGHTHGGQMFPGTTVAQLVWGDRANGLSALGGSQLYVSRGCGFVGPPMRVGSPPELVKVVLLRG